MPQLAFTPSGGHRLADLGTLRFGGYIRYYNSPPPGAAASPAQDEALVAEGVVEGAVQVDGTSVQGIFSLTLHGKLRKGVLSGRCDGRAMVWRSDTLCQGDLQGDATGCLAVLTGWGSRGERTVLDIELAHIHETDQLSPRSPEARRKSLAAYAVPDTPLPASPSAPRKPSAVAAVLSRAGFEEERIPAVEASLAANGGGSVAELAQLPTRSLRASGLSLAESGKVLVHAEEALRGAGGGGAAAAPERRPVAAALLHAALNGMRRESRALLAGRAYRGLLMWLAEGKRRRAEEGLRREAEQRQQQREERDAGDMESSLADLPPPSQELAPPGQALQPAGGCGGGGSSIATTPRTPPAAPRGVKFAPPGGSALATPATPATAVSSATATSATTATARPSPQMSELTSSYSEAVVLPQAPTPQLAPERDGVGLSEGGGRGEQHYVEAARVRIEHLEKQRDSLLECAVLGGQELAERERALSHAEEGVLRREKRLAESEMASRRKADKAGKMGGRIGSLKQENSVLREHLEQVQRELNAKEGVIQKQTAALRRSKADRQDEKRAADAAAAQASSPPRSASAGRAASPVRAGLVDLSPEPKESRVSLTSRHLRTQDCPPYCPRRPVAGETSAKQGLEAKRGQGGAKGVRKGGGSGERVPVATSALRLAGSRMRRSYGSIAEGVRAMPVVAGGGDPVASASGLSGFFTAMGALHLFPPILESMEAVAPDRYSLAGLRELLESAQQQQQQQQKPAAGAGKAVGAAGVAAVPAPVLPAPSASSASGGPDQWAAQPAAQGSGVGCEGEQSAAVEGAATRSPDLVPSQAPPEEEQEVRDAPPAAQPEEEEL